MKSVWLSLADGCEMDPKRNYEDVKRRRVILFAALFPIFSLIFLFYNFVYLINSLFSKYAYDAVELQV